MCEPPRLLLTRRSSGSSPNALQMMELLISVAEPIRPVKEVISASCIQDLLLSVMIQTS